MNVLDIEGSTAGWRPFHRRNFGKVVRDFNLQVHDISPPKCRYVRDPNSEVYEPIEGAQPRQLTRPRSPWSHADLSLTTADIEGTAADSALLKSKVKMRKQKSESRNLVTTQQERAALVAVKLLKTKVLDQMKGKSSKEVVRAFKRNDRQASGKLTIDEVEYAFRTLDVGLNAAELGVFSTAFNNPDDGYMNYWDLLKHLVPVGPTKRKPPGATKVLSMALQGWSRTQEPRPCYFKMAADEAYATEKLNELPKEPKRTEPQVREQGGGARGDARKRDHSLFDKTIDRGKRRKQSMHLQARHRSAPVPIGVPFWPEEKLIRSRPGTPSSYLSLYQDHLNPPNMSAYYRVLDDSEKRWKTNVGENPYTGEANIVCSTSYSEGLQWRPPSSQRVSRCGSLGGVEGFPSRPSTGGSEVRPHLITSRPSTGGYEGRTHHFMSRPSTGGSEGRFTNRPSTATTATRPSSAVPVADSGGESRPMSAGVRFTDENMSLKRGKRPQSASAAMRGSECLRSISNNYRELQRPWTANNRASVKPFSSRAQLMDDIAAVKALS